MYDELVRNLHNEIKYALPSQTRKALIEAADAIEELQQQVEHYHGCMNDWFEAAQEYKAAYTAEHDARIAEIKRELTEKEREAHNAFLAMVARHGQAEPPKEEAK